MNTGCTFSKEVRAFTLVELSAVIVLVCVLGSVAFPALVRSRQQSTLAACRSNLRQIGLALQTYAQANQGSLPGPLTLEVQSSYDNNSREELAWFLADYLKMPKPSANRVAVPVLFCPACPRRDVENDCPPSYLLNDDIDPKKGSRVRPFGSPGNVLQPPLRVAELPCFGSPARIFAVSDADKGNANPQADCWNDLPYTPVHGEERNQLMFDWHVEPQSW